MEDRRRLRLGLRVATVVAALVGLACLEHTRRTLSETFDESNHLAAGLEWWQFGTYTQWTENPPLARIAVATLPYLHGTRLPPPAAWDPRTHDWDRSWEIGNELLYAGDGFEANLGRARLGTLPFFVLTLVAAFVLANGRRRPVAGLIAVALTATLPALIAHGALATTDVAFAATFLLALVALARWLDAPPAGAPPSLGAAFGLALLTKLSTLVFFPAAGSPSSSPCGWPAGATRHRRPPGASWPVRPRSRSVSRSWSRGPAIASRSDASTTSRTRSRAG